MKRINTTQRSPGIQIAVLLLLLSSCTSGEQETGIGRPLEVTAEIAAPVTRATDAHDSDYDKRTFVANDQINIYSGVSASGSATVYKYSDSGSTSKWLPNTGGDGITITTENGAYTASFPTTFSGIKQEQTTPTAFWESNQLISSKVAVGNRVDFVFAPVAAKITINVEYASITTGNGIKLEGNSLRTEGGTNETIQLLPVTASGTNHTYIGIIRANAGAVYKITVSAGGIDKSYAQSSIKLEAANNYIYNFTSTNKLILNCVNVTPFASDGSAESGGDLNAT